MFEQIKMYPEQEINGSSGSMRRNRRQWIGIHTVWILLFIIALLCIPTGCGKKGPPFLPQKTFGAKVIHLQAEPQENHIILKGELQGLKGDPEMLNQVSGCRVYYAQYPLAQPPCAGCPIEFNNQQKFGPEIVSQNAFFCELPDIQAGQIYFIKVVLTGADGSMGPVSERIRIDIP